MKSKSRGSPPAAAQGAPGGKATSVTEPTARRLEKEPIELGQPSPPLESADTTAPGGIPDVAGMPWEAPVGTPAHPAPSRVEAGSKLLSPFLDLVIERQPDDFTCGPTCLQAVYNYYGDHVPISEVIAGVETVIGGGTLAVNLASHALERGYGAVLYTYDLNVFDPTWFALPVEQFLEKLRAQQRAKRDPRLQVAASAYMRFLKAGGELRFEELQEGLLRRHLSKGQPMLTGLSATYLYSCAREYREDYDDVRGEPTGHFVVLSGYDRSTHQVHVADPLHDNPGFPGHRYAVSVSRFIAAVLLGVLTYDANLLVLIPKKGRC